MFIEKTDTPQELHISYFYEVSGWDSPEVYAILLFNEYIGNYERNEFGLHDA